MRRILLCAVAVVTLAGTTSALAARARSHVHVSVSPASAACSDTYTVKITGKAAARAALILAMTKTGGAACPTSYARGRSSLYGITSDKGKTVEPTYVHGTLRRTIEAELGVHVAGRYAICAYLSIGNKTVARGSVRFTVTS